MAGNVFLFGSVLSPERMSWIEETIKIHCQKKSAGESGSGGPEIEAFSFFLTGEAVYSLRETETQVAWDSLGSLPGIHITADTDALSHRGILPDQVEDRYSGSVSLTGLDSMSSFWSSVLAHMPESPVPGNTQIGWIQLSSPYSSPAAEYGIACMSEAVENNDSVSFFAFLDGCHTVHSGQAPKTGMNFGESLAGIAQRSAEKGLSCAILTDRYSSSARGYLSWDNGSGTIGSSCSIRPAHIREVDSITRQVAAVTILLSENTGHITGSSAGEPSGPIVILITHNPYSTGFAYGGISFAVASASQGIPTRVIFLEDGVYSVSGEHQAQESSFSETIPGLLAHLAGTSTVEFFALIPSLARRGISKNGKLNMVTEVDYAGLAGILFEPDSGRTVRKIIFF